jgi:NTP pyrophosphatase (non-canonical NTP hydrolase)
MTTNGRLSKQLSILSAVANRGYVNYWTPRQFIARQAVKLLEESCELFLAFPFPTCAKFARLRELALVVREEAGRLFDDRQAWQAVTDAGSLNQFRGELADCGVVAACAAEMLRSETGRRMDLLEEALKKAQGDVNRGVRD